MRLPPVPARRVLASPAGKENRRRFHAVRIRRAAGRYLLAIPRGDTDDLVIDLTPTEFKLLHILACEPGQVLTHGQLLREVWGPTRLEDVHYLRVYMKQLRRKIEGDPSQPKRILTALGVGYRLNPSSDL